MQAMNQFRMETREWLEDNCPASMRTAAGFDEMVWGGRNATFSSEDQKLWMERMGNKGWTAPRWPKKYGGGGLDKEQAAILAQELKRINARTALSSFGIWMLGPALLEFANEEQKLEHLPKIVRGEIRWCQGYSEPNAGSDLASLKTSAILDKDEEHFIVNGQKVWTSYADFADWIFCLVRTDSSGSKHEGISFLLFDMTSEGVDTKPITLISGASPFCETFFKDVKVPKKNLVGEPGKGWTIAKRLLQHERSSISAMGSSSGESYSLFDLVNDKREFDADGTMSDKALRNKIAQLQVDSEAFGELTRRWLQEGFQSPLTSLLKYIGSELNKDRRELMVKTAGFDGLAWEANPFAEHDVNIAKQWLRSKANSIEGGTSEVQLNVIAKRTLNLPT